MAPFGIRVLIIEPGSFRTNFLSAGASQTVWPSGPYQSPHPVGDSLQHEQAIAGKQPGDPDKAVRVIYEAIAGQDERLRKVLRLPIGSDSWHNGLKHLKRVRSDFESSKEEALSTQIVE